MKCYYQDYLQNVSENVSFKNVIGNQQRNYCDIFHFSFFESSLFPPYCKCKTSIKTLNLDYVFFVFFNQGPDTKYFHRDFPFKKEVMYYSENLHKQNHTKLYLRIEKKEIF